MRVFVLCAERSGSHTLAAACAHIANYTIGHETRAAHFTERLDYPDGHIEIDNRLVWFLGGLEKLYGDTPVYVHLTRDPDRVADSCTHRFGVMMRGWSIGILRCGEEPEPAGRLAYTRAYVDAVTDNIEVFLRDKAKVVRLAIESPHEPFDQLWQVIGAEGDVDAAHATLDRVHHKRRRRG